MGAIFMALTDAQKLNQTRQTAASLQQAKDSTPGRRQGDVAAKITAYDATTGYFSWTEQAFDEDGVRYDKPSGLSGTPTYMPALALASAGDYPITTFPAQVWLRPVIVSGTLGQVWEVLGGVIEVDLVEKICVTKVSGVVTDITIQKGVYQLWGQRVADADCSTGDADCCPYVTVPCCENPIPRYLKACLRGTVDCTCYNHDINLVYLGETTPGTFSWGTVDSNGDYGYMELEGTGGSPPCASSPLSPVLFNLLVQCTATGWKIGGIAINSDCIYNYASPSYTPSPIDCDPATFTLGPDPVTLTSSGCCGVGGEITITIIAQSATCP